MKKKLFSILALMLFAAGTWAQDLLFLAGGATPADWSDNEARSPGAMLKTGDGTWVWYGRLTTGDGDDGAFKLPTTNSGWGSCYYAPSAWYNLQPGVEADLTTNGDGDHKFSVAEEGLYRVTVNISTMKIRADLLTGSLTQVDGYYQIGSLDDYFLFVATISDMNTEGVKARLTADLDFTDSYFYPLANERFKFKGEFDGAGHTVKGISVATKHNSMGFIRWAANGAHIHDLVVEGSIEGDSKIGGIIARIHDGGTVKLTNVVNRIVVTATGSNDANAAAFLSCAEGDTKIEALNCLNAGDVSGQSGQCGAFCGWAQEGSSFTNCINCAAINGIEGSNQLYRGGSSTLTNCYDFTASGSQGTQGDPAKLASGEFCYQLNGDQSTITWYQTIGGDAHPYPIAGHEVVYYVGGAYINIYTLTISEETDNSEILTTYNGKLANVTLTRTLQTGGWNTFCVPFSIATPSGWTVKELTASSFNSSTGALSLTFGNAASIVAGTPYLVKVTSNVVNPTFDGVTISKTAVTTETTAVDFVPTLGQTEITGDANDILFLSSGNKLLHPSSLPANMKGFRAYFQLKGEAALARSFSMDFGDGETTGIITIENGQSVTSKAIYDLQGRRVNGTAQKGVYIVNGKKTVIK